MNTYYTKQDENVQTDGLSANSTFYQPTLKVVNMADGCGEEAKFTSGIYSVWRFQNNHTPGNCRQQTKLLKKTIWFGFLI